MIGFLTAHPYALLPFVCGMVIIVTGYIKLWKLRKTNHPETIGIFGIWLMGIIGLLLGIFGQVLSIVEAFDAIADAGTISASIVADGIKSSYKSTLVGLAVLIISLIVWGILKGVKQNKMMRKAIEKA